MNIVDNMIAMQRRKDAVRSHFLSMWRWMTASPFAKYSLFLTFYGLLMFPYAAFCAGMDLAGAKNMDSFTGRTLRPVKAVLQNKYSLFLTFYGLLMFP